MTLQKKEEERLREEFAKQGIKIPVKDKSDVFDSNTITPGTPFMHRLSIALQYYIHCRLNSDPGWKGITVSSIYRQHADRHLVLSTCIGSMHTDGHNEQLVLGDVTSDPCSHSTFKQSYAFRF